MKRLRNYLVAGLVVLFPVIITWQVLVWLFNLVDGLLRGLVVHIFGRPVPGVGLAFTVVIVLIVGMLAANYFGRRIIAYIESLIAKTPLVRGVYVTMRQLTDAFIRQEKAAFQRVALIEYPRKGIYTLAFITAAAPQELDRRTGVELVAVFVPTTPNPTSGFLLYLPKREVVLLDMPVEHGLKLVISGGLVVPPGESQGRQVGSGADRRRGFRWPGFGRRGSGVGEDLCVRGTGGPGASAGESAGDGA
ncbi:MAG: DUF502 domain-containing protein [Firmicutes bacterium]|nr:DUF502 domain-containing protein [Bacillota bacterium]